MNIEEIRDFCLQKKGITEEFPFNETTLVFKVMGKMFLLVALDRWETGQQEINVKCDPEKAIQLREKFPDDIYVGPYMNKKHWNTIKVNTVLPDKKIKHFINHSYELVVAKLTKKQKEELKNLD